MKREPMKPSTDKAIYTHTARKIKKVNVTPKISRGGIRF